MAAFSAAEELGAHAIELDTMLSSDGIPVVIHDHTLGRTTNGSGFVNRYSYSELTKLDAGRWFSESFLGEKIPSLQQVIKEFSGKLLINIELKNYHSPKDNLVATVIRMVDQFDLWDSILFSSFLPRNIQMIKTRNPNAKVALLCSEGITGWLARSVYYQKLSPEIIHPAAVDANRAYIMREHKNGRRVHAWTINDPKAAEKLIFNQIDGIFTDDPEKMLALINILTTQHI